MEPSPLRLSKEDRIPMTLLPRNIDENAPHYEDCKSFKSDSCNCSAIQIKIDWAEEEMRRMKMPKIIRYFLRWYRKNPFPEL